MPDFGDTRLLLVHSMSTIGNLVQFHTNETVTYTKGTTRKVIFQAGYRNGVYVVGEITSALVTTSTTYAPNYNEPTINL